MRDAVLLFLSLVWCCTAQVSDTTPPRVVSFTLSSTTPDTTNGPAVLVVRVRVTDDLSGFNSARSSFLVQSHGQSVSCALATVVSGTPKDSISECTVRLPQYFRAGPAQLSFQVWDFVGNWQIVGSSALAAAGLLSQIEVKSTSDVQPPEVTSLGFFPASVDVSSGLSNVEIHLAVSDLGSGAKFTGCSAEGGGDFVLVSPSGAQRRILTRPDFKLDTGTPQEGNWSASLLMPQHSEAGTWKLEGVTLGDRAGNHLRYTGTQLAGSGISGAFKVVSATPDVTPPVLRRLVLTPDFVNTSFGPQTITVTIQAADDLSGVSFDGYPTKDCVFAMGITLTSPSGKQYVQFQMNRQDRAFASLHQGTPLDGEWWASIVMPQFSEAGTWTITKFRLRDRVMNEVTYSAEQLTALGIPTKVQVIQP